MRGLLAIVRVLAGFALVAVGIAVLIDPRGVAFRLEEAMPLLEQVPVLAICVIIAVATVVFTTGVILITGLRLYASIFAAFALATAVDATIGLPRYDTTALSVGTDCSAFAPETGESAAIVVWDCYALDNDDLASITDFASLADSCHREFVLLTSDTTALARLLKSRAATTIPATDATTAVSATDAVTAVTDTVTGIASHAVYTTPAETITTTTASATRATPAISKTSASVAERNAADRAESVIGCKFEIKQISRRTLRALMRSNGGAVLFSEGIVAYKCPCRSITGRAMHRALDKDGIASITDGSRAETIYIIVLVSALLVTILTIRRIRLR